jgi:hypothetical protein
MRSLFITVGKFVFFAGACNSHPMATIAKPSGNDGVVAVVPDAGIEVSSPDSEIIILGGPDSGVEVMRSDGGGSDRTVAGDTVLAGDRFIAPDLTPVPDAPRQPIDMAPQVSRCVSEMPSSVILCDDFSNPAPVIQRVEHPWQDLPDMAVFLSDEKVVIADPGSWSASYVQWSSPVDFRDTSLEVDMTAATAARSLSFVMWGGPPTYISAGLQRDEKSLYLFIVVNDLVVARLSASVSMAPNRTQRVGLEIRANGQIQCTVDGAVVLVTTADLSPYPRILPAGIGADSYPSQQFTYDNLTVRRLTGP